MKPEKSHAGATSRNLRSVAILLCCLPFACALTAADARNGTLSGVVSNQATKDVLKDARVEIPIQRIMTLTDELGRFVIRDLPPGDYQVEVSYMGLDTQRRTIKVTAGEETLANFELTTEIYNMETYVVTGEREGNAAAITRQRMADNIKNVLSLDAFGNLANNNVGELLIRVPGVVGASYEDDGGVDALAIRGAPPHMTTFSVDGNMQASANGWERAYRTTIINAAMFDEIEVTKAPTPDMPADSLGGSVNMRTRSTLRNKKPYVFVNAFARWAAPFHNTIPMREDHPLHGQFNAGYRDIFSIFGGKRNLGISLTGYYSENTGGWYKSVYRYENTDKDPAYIYDYYNMDGYNIRENIGAKLRLDFHVLPSWVLYANLIYNDNKQVGNRAYRARALAWGSAATPAPASIKPGYTEDVTEMTASGNYPEVYSTSYLYSIMIRERTFNIGGNHNWGRVLLDYDANYNYSHSNLGDGLDGPSGGVFEMRVRPVGLTIDKSDSAGYPTITHTPGTKSPYVAENYVRPNLITRDGRQRDTDVYNFSTDLRYVLPTPFAASLKAGARYRSQKVDTMGGDTRMWYQGTVAHLASLVDPSIVTSAGFGDAQIPFIDSVTAAQDIKNNPQNWYGDPYTDEVDYYQETRNIKEDVTAAYVQGSARIGRFNFLGGVRFERTKTNALGYIRSPRVSTYEERVANPDPLWAQRDFGNENQIRGNNQGWFPSLHVTYTILKNFQARVSWSNTTGRPGLRDLAPSMSYSDPSQADMDEDIHGTLYVNNPYIKPQYSENWDISLEYYFKDVGQFSIGVFRKDIEDFIVTADLGIIGRDNNSAMTEILGYYPRYDESEGYRLRSTFNGGTAKIEGIEVSYQQNLSFLPGFLKGLSVFANYTHLKTTGDYGRDINSPTKKVARFVPDSGNAGITWKYRKFSASVMANRASKHLYTYATTNYYLHYKKARTQVNMNLSYKLNSMLSLTCDITDAFRKPHEWYYYKENRPEQYRVADTVITFGVSGNF